MGMSNKNSPNWTTDDELAFIAGIKSLMLIRSYIKALELRSNWAGMDRSTVEMAAERKLFLMEAISKQGSYLSHEAITGGGD